MLSAKSFLPYLPTPLKRTKKGYRFTKDIPLERSLTIRQAQKTRSKNFEIMLVIELNL